MSREGCAGMVRMGGRGDRARNPRRTRPLQRPTRYHLRAPAPHRKDAGLRLVRVVKRRAAENQAGRYVSTARLDPRDVCLGYPRFDLTAERTLPDGAASVSSLHPGVGVHQSERRLVGGPDARAIWRRDGTTITLCRRLMPASCRGRLVRPKPGSASRSVVKHAAAARFSKFEPSDS